MSGQGQQYEALNSQDALNERADSIPLRRPVEGFSSDDDDSSPTKALNKKQLDGTPRRSPPKAGEHTTIVERRTSRRPWRRFCACAIPSKRVCILIIIVLAAILGAAFGGGGWVYKSAPKDGLSPPWYPTPRGGTVKNWETSFERARDMVQKMSLVEKVNVTTGTGYIPPFRHLKPKLTCNSDGR